MHWAQVRRNLRFALAAYGHSRSSSSGCCPAWAGHLAHKAMSCIAFLGDSPETQSSWQRGDVLRRVYLTMLEEDVHIIAGSDKWEHVTERSGVRVHLLSVACMSLRWQICGPRSEREFSRCI